MSSNNWLAGALAAGFLSAASASLHAADRPEIQTRIVEEIIAKVNGEIITRGELEKQRVVIQQQLEKQGLAGPALDQAVNKAAADALRDQIDQLLLVQKGKDLSINVDADVNRRVADIQKTSGLADPDKFHDWVREQTGESFEDLKLAFKNQLLTQRVIGEEVYRNVSIPKADMQKYYDDHKAEFVRKETVSVREILISSGDNTPAKVAAAEKKAKDVVDRARKGEKFPELARQYSDAETAKEDGMLGTFTKGQLTPAIENVIFPQKKGYITDPIKIPAGFEIMKVEERTAEGQASFEEVQNEIQNRLSEPKVQPKLRELLTQLRKKAFLQIKPGYLDSGAAPEKDTAWKDPAQLKPQTTTKEAVANQRRFKKFMKVVPYGRTGAKDTQEAAPPAVAPVPSTPVKNADGSGK
ncbi:MAG: peptidyl-prolyl cis-trans isomerase SurA [Bryobacterales bacterium]|jgi:parvulin-like peptidyl-prolyl isomerase|nr:peptidyl-prolyl cis-trans isomerase SurA [Bryobacterales bacterium]